MAKVAERLVRFWLVFGVRGGAQMAQNVFIFDVPNYLHFMIIFLTLFLIVCHYVRQCNGSNKPRAGHDMFDYVSGSKKSILRKHW